ncbi:hypothetical protein J2TS4_04720 [Paenibacillus sp. J2TS4]|nr:hypothetical protein J2TS4_04720 [Paenibacillus sp. J2TS4]
MSGMHGEQYSPSFGNGQVYSQVVECQSNYSVSYRSAAVYIKSTGIKDTGGR